MENTGYIALSRQSVLRRKMDVIANNLANANTVGFKHDLAVVRQRPIEVNEGGEARFAHDLLSAAL